MTNADVVLADPNKLGTPGRTYDGILVSASSNDFPEILYDQLKIGARMVIPVRESIWLVKKTEDGTISKTQFPGFRFVPLISGKV